MSFCPGRPSSVQRNITALAFKKALINSNPVLSSLILSSFCFHAFQIVSHSLVFLYPLLPPCSPFLLFVFSQSSRNQPPLFVLPALQTFHTPSLGDEEFEIPPISLDPDSALTVSDVVSHFGELSDSGPSDSVVVPRNAVVEGDDPSFASTFVNNPSQGLEHLTLGVINQSGGSALLGSSLGMVRSRGYFKCLKSSQC